MEKEGLVRGLAAIKEAGLTVSSLVTDRHPQINKYMETEETAIIHKYDIWHVAKSKYFSTILLSHIITVLYMWNKIIFCIYTETKVVLPISIH